MQRVLITGAAGTIGSVLRQGLRGRVRSLRLLDIAPLGTRQPGEELVTADIRDPASLTAAMADVDVTAPLGRAARLPPRRRRRTLGGAARRPRCPRRPRRVPRRRLHTSRHRAPVTHGARGLSRLREPRLHRSDHPLGVSNGRIRLLHRDIDGPVIRLVPPLEQRAEQPPDLLVELATADQQADERRDDPGVLGTRLAKRKKGRFPSKERGEISTRDSLRLKTLARQQPSRRQLLPTSLQARLGHATARPSACARISNGRAASRNSSSPTGTAETTASLR